MASLCAGTACTLRSVAHHWEAQNEVPAVLGAGCCPAALGAQMEAQGQKDPGLP